MVEWRSPTSRGITIPEADLMSDPESAGEIRRLSEEFDIELAYHAPQGPLWEFGDLPIQIAVSRLRECVRRASSINASIMTFHLGISHDERRIATIHQAGKVIKSVFPYAEDLGVCLCVENVFKSDRCSVATVSEFKALFEAASDSKLRFTLDTGHANLYGILYELVESLPEKLFFTHIHDNDGTRDQHRVPGRGTIDWRRLLSCFDSAGYTGPLNFELREECALSELVHILGDYATGSSIEFAGNS